jgi:hypothetical protein
MNTVELCLSSNFEALESSCYLDILTFQFPASNKIFTPWNEEKNTPSSKSLPLVFYLTKQVHAFCIATIQLIDAFLPSCRGSRARICVVSGEFLPSFLHLKIRPVTTGNVEPMTKYFVRNVLQFGVVTIERRK